MENNKTFWEPETGDWQVELRELEKSYGLKTVKVEINRRLLELIKVANIDALLDRANDPDEIPFWAELWPASIGLARFIMESESALKADSVLELGAGVGLAGITAKIAGYRVVQSDFTIEALRFIRVNCLKNQVAASGLLLADWRNFPIPEQRYDLIIGADILYEKNLHSYLWKIFKESLKPGGCVVLADPGRDYARDFIKYSAAEGWRVEQTRRPVFYEGRSYTIDLYRLSVSGTE